MAASRMTGIPDEPDASTRCRSHLIAAKSPENEIGWPLALAMVDVRIQLYPFKVSEVGLPFIRWASRDGVPSIGYPSPQTRSRQAPQQATSGARRCQIEPGFSPELSEASSASSSRFVTGMRRRWASQTSPIAAPMANKLQA